MMKGEICTQEQSNNRGKRSHGKIVLYAVLLVLLIVNVVIYKTRKPYPDEIMMAVAGKLNKTADELTADDFTGLKEL